MSAADELRRRYVDILRAEGALRRDDMAGAFGAVPREVFVADGFYGRDGGWVTPDEVRFLDTVYSNDVLVTKVVDGVPVSSSSQPSLMAVMLDALDPAPGMRVLEIGAGTGYNAAFMAAMGVRVTSVDAQPDVVDRAAAALRRAGAAGVAVHAADGYLGDPSGPGGFDRVIATVGVSGVSPHWLDQLAPGGFVIAPVAHAGNHPVLRVRSGADGRVRAEGICHAGFMPASGPLSARYPGAHPESLRTGVLPAPTLAYPARWRPPLNVYRYHDLWFAAGVWDRRVTFAAMEGAAGAGGCALLDETRAGGAGIMVDGAVLATGQQAPQYADAALALRDRWVELSEPTVAAWRATMMLAGDPNQPIWAPRDWSLRQSG